MKQKHSLFLSPHFSATLIAVSLIFGLFLTPLSASAQKSKRVMRDRQDDTLSVQQSSAAGGSVTGSTTSMTPGSSLTPSSTSSAGDTPLSYTSSAGKAVAQPAPLTVNQAAPIYNTNTNNNNNAGMMQMLGLAPALMKMFTGDNKSDTTPGSRSSGTGTSSSTGSGGSSGGSSTRTPSVYNDDDGDELPAPPAKRIPNCNSTQDENAWRPFTTERFVVTSCFTAAREHPTTHVVRPHTGIDIGPSHAGRTDQPVTPVSKGVIESAGEAGGYGCMIVIKHENCPSGLGDQKNCTTRYAHLAKENGKCPGTVGQTVKPCDRIAFMGDTPGKHLNSGIHLHFEVRTSSGEAVSPSKRFPEWRGYENYMANESSCKGRKSGGGTPPAELRKTTTPTGRN